MKAAKRPAAKKPAPVVFSAALGARICEWIADGETLREFCRQPGSPTWRTVYNWIDRHEEFAKAMEAARDIGARAIAEEALEIADDSRNDYVDRVTRDGGTERVFDAEHVQRSKLRIETRLKLLAKWHKKVYGDSVTVAGDAENPLVVKGAPPTDEELVEIARRAHAVKP